MLDIKYIQDNPDKVQKAAQDKSVNVDIGKVLDTDREYREILQKVEELRAERNRVAKERNIERGKEIKGELDGLESRLKELETSRNELLFSIPNPAKDDVKVGKDDSENDVIKTVGEIPKFDFKVRDHVELGEMLDIIDIDRAAKVSGARFYYLKNEGALLEIALMRYAIDTIMQDGFKPVIPPVLIKRDVMKRLGYMEHGADEDVFAVPSDDLVLVGTAEHSIVAMHTDETFNKKELPVRYVGFSSSFRREAGSYGKDTRGILRVHQFDKVEMVSYVAQGEDDKEHDLMLAIEEKLFSGLGLAYQVIKQCTGDLGFTAARKYDIEAWIPSQEKYREVTSTSTIGEFQSRRLNVKYQDGPPAGGEKKYVNILNGTGIYMARGIIAVLENYQQEDGSVVIPEALRKYTGFDRIEVKNLRINVKN
jgi:seryl-tRNA synthetase